MIFSNDALAGKHILVTGASSGLGRETASALADAGARVTCSGRNEERLHAAVAALPGTGHTALAAELSSVEAAHDVAARAAKDAGPLDGIFHAAGVSAIRSSKMLSSEHVDSLFGASIDAAFGIAKAASKRNVLNDGGSVLFMSSVAAVRGRAGMAAYAASKAAIGGLTRALAAELAPRSVRVNELIAGAVETEMHEQIVKGLDDDGIAAYRDLHMLGFGKPSDISSAALFLLSDAARWITGASIPVDGGYTAK